MLADIATGLAPHAQALGSDGSGESMQNHHFPIEIDTLSGRQGRSHKAPVYWSLDPDGTLLVFVHGFGGKATATWRSFPQLLLDDRDFSGCDVLFYEYESRRAHAAASAALLFEFLDRLVSSPAAHMKTSAPRTTGFKYHRIVLVAHSLGAAIVRSMLVDAAEHQTPWLLSTDLICFAPASSGARLERIARLAGMQGVFLFSFVYSLLSHRWPVVDDLAVGSSFLRDLHSRTEMAAANGFKRRLTARLVLFGERENVIDYAEPFPFDRPYKTVGGHDHSSICKPRIPQDATYIYFKQSLKPTWQVREK